MGLLDSDAEELKNRSKTDKPSSGRKVNESGLGAFKGLSKYANLTKKYRESSKEVEEQKSPTVEHGRGTSPLPSSSASTEVGTKSVQTRDKELLEEGVCTTSFPTSSSNNNESKVGTNPGQSQDEVRAKSVPTSRPDNGKSHSESEKSDTFQAPNEATEKSVQSQDKIDLANCSVEASELNSSEYKSLKSVQSQNEAGTKPVHSHLNSSDSTSIGFTTTNSSTSSLSQDEVSTSDNLSQDNVSTKSVQSRNKVGSRFKQALSGESLSKSGQSQDKVGTTQSQNLGINQNSNTPAISSYSAEAENAGVVPSHSQVPAIAERLPNSEVQFDQMAEQIVLPPSPVIATTGIKPVQSQDKARTKSVQNLAKEESVLSSLAPTQPGTIVQTSQSLFASSGAPSESSLEQDPRVHPSYQIDKHIPQTESATPQDVSFQSNGVRFEVRTNSGQTQDKAGTQSVQSQDIDSTNSGPSRYQVGSKVRTQVGTKLVRSGDKLDPLEGVTTLVGAQRKIVEFLFENCLWNNDFVTSPITKEQLMAGTQLSEDTAITSVKRLRKKRILDRVAYKDGKAGWTQYELAESVYRELLHLRQAGSKWGQSEDKVGSKVSTTVGTMPSSSSSFSFKDNSNKTTTSEDELNQDWLEIDTSPIESIGFGRTQLLQLKRNRKLHPEEIAASILYFAYDLNQNNKAATIKSNPLNFFMGILKDGPYSKPKNYVDPETLRLLQLQEEKAREAALRREALDKLKVDQFEIWLYELPVDQRKKLGAPYPLGSQGERAQLSIYFEEHCWPKLLEQALLKREQKNAYESAESNTDLGRTQATEESKIARKALEDQFGAQNWNDLPQG